MRFRKVKFNGLEVLIEWQTQIGEDWVDHTLKSEDAPRKEFGDALDALTEHMLAALELPDEYGEELDVRSVAITHSSDGEKGYVISATKKLENFNAPLNLHTPHMPGEVLDTEFLRAFIRVQREAKKYVEGIRLNGDLFAGRRDETGETGEEEIPEDDQPAEIETPGQPTPEVGEDEPDEAQWDQGPQAHRRRPAAMVAE